jgi:predicted RND superfamily exporter protein
MLDTVLEHPIWCILGILCLTGIGLSQVVDLRTGEPRLTLDSSTSSLLPDDDEHRRYLDHLGSLFDTGETLLIALVTEDVFTSENLSRIQRISERLEAHDLVLSVSSLATALNIRGDDGELLIEPFFDEVPDDDAGLADLRARALADPIYAGNLVSEDGRISVIAVRLLEVPDQELIDSGLDGDVDAIVEEERGDVEVWISGGARIKAELSRLMLADLSFVLPSALALMGLVAFLSFRTLRGVAIPMLTVLLAVVWTMGFVARFYGQLNQVTVAAPPVLLVVGFAYSIHLLSAYYGALRR